MLWVCGVRRIGNLLCQFNIRYVRTEASTHEREERGVIQEVLCDLGMANSFRVPISGN